MRHLLLTSIVIITFFINSTAQYSHALNNTLTDIEKEEGWELLFNGKTLEGWRGFGMDNAPDGWVVEDGMIKILPKTDWPRQADGQPILGADLITVETYKDFELVWDWKIEPGGNSGVKYNVSEELSLSYPPKGCALGFEYQMMDDTGLSGRSLNNSTGALYDLVAPAKEKLLNPIGEFNTSRIVFRGNRGEHWLNAKKCWYLTWAAPLLAHWLKTASLIPSPGLQKSGKAILSYRTMQKLHGSEISKSKG